MWEFRLGDAFGLMVRTLPFILMRMVIYFGITLAFILVTGVGAGVGWGVGAFSGGDFQAGSTFWGGAIGFGLTAGVLFFLREYILYMVKAAHIAVLVELMEGKDLPDGRNQIEHGQAVVRARFAEANVLFALDQIIKGVLRALTSLAQGIANFIPIPGLSQAVGVLKAVLNVAVGFIDEVILGYNIRTKSENPWASARTALVLYGQNSKTMMINAVWLTVIMYVLSFVLFLVLLAPAAGIAFLMPGDFSAFGFVIAILLAWSIKAAFLEPLAITCMMQVYFKAIEGQTPNPEWEQRLSDMSSKFRDMGEKAANWVKGRSASGEAL